MSFNGLGMNMGNLSRLSSARSRSISAENFTGEKGKGGMATEGTGAECARDLGVGWKVSPSVYIGAGETFTLADIQGSGAIQSMWISGHVSRDFILRVYWDDQEHPAIECPLTDFFAVPWLADKFGKPTQGIKLTLNSLPVSVNPNCGLNCFWEMPFRSRCLMTLENIDPKNDRVCYYQVNYTETDVPDDCAYFHAQYRRVNPLPYGEVYTIVFFVPRFIPGNPVDAMLGRLMSQGATMDPVLVESMRTTMTELFGLEGTLWEQYSAFVRRVVVTQDFGPSLSNYPTPVSALIARALPWSLALLLTALAISWILGNLIGLLAGYHNTKLIAKIIETVAMIIYPIPYYIFALLLVIVFAYIWPVFPFVFLVSGTPGTWQWFSSVAYNSFLPLMSIVIVSLGWWTISMKAMAIDTKEEDYVQYARYRGINDNKIMVGYVARTAILPQITVLALSIGSVFGGALITEILFGYPGIGTLIYRAVLSTDYNLIMGTVSISIVAVATATLIMDLVYPFIDPRIRYK